MVSYLKKMIYFFRDVSSLMGIMSFFDMLFVLYQLKVIKKPIVKFKYLGHQLFISNDGPVIYHMVFSTKKIKNLVDSITLENLKTCFDVGANSGLFTYFVKQKYPDAEVHCFEPSPELEMCAKLNLERFENIFFIKKAVSDVVGEVKFYINTASQQTNSLIIGSVEPFCEGESMHMISTESETIDNYCDVNGIESIDVLKVDIQGAEKALLDGSSKMLDNVNISIFEISFLDQDIFDTTEILLNKFNTYSVINEVKMGADIIFSNDNIY